MYALSYVVNGCSIQTAETSDWFEIGFSKYICKFLTGLQLPLHIHDANF